MSEERAIALSDRPQPTSGVPVPELLADEYSLLLRYYTDGERVVVIYFPTCCEFRFGGPNDEALHGHPLWGKGLTFYAVHRVENSSRIHELERQNSVHTRHNRERFLKNKWHYIFTFHDSTLECFLFFGDRFREMEASVFDDDAEADHYVTTVWRHN
jgi:hypothetical protein